MDDITDDEKKFMDKYFKAGEYSVLTILVNNKELSGLIELLKLSGLNLALLPGVRPKLDFADDTKKGTEQ